MERPCVSPFSCSDALLNATKSGPLPPMPTAIVAHREEVLVAGVAGQVVHLVVVVALDRVAVRQVRYPPEAHRPDADLLHVGPDPIACDGVILLEGALPDPSVLQSEYAVSGPGPAPTEPGRVQRNLDRGCRRSARSVRRARACRAGASPPGSPAGRCRRGIPAGTGGGCAAPPATHP